jgi:hypothetical protein
MVVEGEAEEAVATYYNGRMAIIQHGVEEARHKPRHQAGRESLVDIVDGLGYMHPYEAMKPSDGCTSVVLTVSATQALSSPNLTFPGATTNLNAGSRPKKVTNVINETAAMKVTIMPKGPMVVARHRSVVNTLLSLSHLCVDCP